MRTAMAVTVGLLLAASLGAQDLTAPESVDLVTEARVSPPPLVTAVGLAESGRRDDPPDLEPLDRDEFLGQVSAPMPAGAFTERVDPFSGTLHLTMV